MMSSRATVSSRKGDPLSYDASKELHSINHSGPLANKSSNLIEGSSHKVSVRSYHGCAVLLSVSGTLLLPDTVCIWEKRCTRQKLKRGFLCLVIYSAIVRCGYSAKICLGIV